MPSLTDYKLCMARVADHICGQPSGHEGLHKCDRFIGPWNRVCQAEWLMPPQGDCPVHSIKYAVDQRPE
jgi:hypothetical protein